MTKKLTTEFDWDIILDPGGRRTIYLPIKKGRAHIRHNLIETKGRLIAFRIKEDAKKYLEEKDIADSHEIVTATIGIKEVT